MKITLLHFIALLKSVTPRPDVLATSSLSHPHEKIFYEAQHLASFLQFIKKPSFINCEAVL